MIAVLDSIGTYNDKVREWQRRERTQAEGGTSPTMQRQGDGLRPPHLLLELPAGPSTERTAAEAGTEALQAVGQRGLEPGRSGPRTKIPRII